MTTSHRSLLILFVTVILLAGYNFIGAAWTPAPSTPPNNNTAAPVNVSNVTQAKTGNLAANIFAATVEMRSNRYCDALGENCFTATSTGDGGDTITVGGECFEPAWAVVCNWNWSGDGNDDSTYIINKAATPSNYCAMVKRTYRSHSMILAQCGVSNGAYEWVASSWGSCETYNAICRKAGGDNEEYSCTKQRQNRTVTCKNNVTNATVADSYCAGLTKPPITRDSCG